MLLHERECWGYLLEHKKLILTITMTFLLSALFGSPEPLRYVCGFRSLSDILDKIGDLPKLVQVCCRKDDYKYNHTGTGVPSLIQLKLLDMKS